MPSPFEAFANTNRPHIEAALERYLTSQSSPWCTEQNTKADTLDEAMRYSALGGGKRLRAMLVYASFDAIKKRIDYDACNPLAAAVECIHAYSLVHDDLPAMDDDALRRGKPTCHIQFNEATAILTGDALLTLAFELICDSPLEPQQTKASIKTLASASGSAGMVGGQQLDLIAEGVTLTQAQLQTIHELKTGALIRAAASLGAIAAGASPTECKAIDHYARNIGLAFQVVDDILDIEGDTQTLGKQAGADQALEKSTYPALLGLAASKQYAEKLVHQAKAALDEAKLESTTLLSLADFVLNRHH